MLDITPEGKSTFDKFAIKVWRALNGSVWLLNLSVTTDKPKSDTERKVCTPGIPAKAFSTGMVICCSTSVVPRPGHCEIAWMVRGATPGYGWIGKDRSANTPRMRSKTQHANTIMRLWMTPRTNELIRLTDYSCLVNRSLRSTAPFTNNSVFGSTPSVMANRFPSKSKPLTMMRR